MLKIKRFCIGLYGSPSHSYGVLTAIWDPMPPNTGKRIAPS